jgi:hypothetical protein
MRCADCTKEKKKIKISKIFEKYNIANIMLVSQYAQHKKKFKINYFIYVTVEMKQGKKK